MSEASGTTGAPRKRRLFEAADDGAVALVGGRCRCGHLFFPMQRLGCEKCGRAGSDLSETRLGGVGRLHAHAQVHLHARPYPKVPFTVLEIALDDGPLIRALLDQPADAALRNGDRMVATIVREQRTEGEVTQLRFRCAEAQ